MALSGVEAPGSRPVTSVEPTRPVDPVRDTSQEDAERLSRLEVGKQFQAQIVSRYKDGSFNVRIADASARMFLPAGGKVGDDLALTLLATTPRPTFSLDSQASGTFPGNLLARGAGAAQALYLSNTALQDASAHKLTAGVFDTESAPAALSNAGRMIAGVMTAARDDGTGTALIGRLPLSLTAGTGAPQLASALQDTLTFSGLFYESHVYQWANGRRPLADLMREPQAHGSTASVDAAAAQTVKAADVTPQVLEMRRKLLEYFSAAPLPGAGNAGAEALDPGLAHLIGLQLNTLEHQRVQWQGELWPGQPMEWEVGRDQGQAQADGENAQTQQWQSVVRFTLPSLGVVSATIDLSGDRVRIQVRTDSDATSAALRLNGPGLASALDAAGSILEGLSIKREVAPDGDA